MSNPLVKFEGCTLAFGEEFRLSSLNFAIGQGETWALLGPNGAGKSALVAALTGEGEVRAGQRELSGAQLALVSLEEQARLIAREARRDNSDLDDSFFPGTPVSELLEENCQAPEVKEALVASLGLTGLLNRGFRKLSTGETRRLLLVRALASGAECLVLDEPYEGLDLAATAKVREVLAELAGKRTLIMVLNRIDELPDFVDRVIYLKQGRVAHDFNCADLPPAAVRERLHQLLHISAGGLALPPPEAPVAPRLNSDGSLVRLRKGRIAYVDNLVFEGLDWQISPGEHWQVMGPNGSGKTCLLSLVIGDHPQCYVNDLCQFGYQRGQGESVWDIKQHLGFVSTALHWDYRLGVSVRKVILSGFHDSIGLYHQATEAQEVIAEGWLALLGMEAKAGQSFSRLSYGEQRLLLIARAMVKHPPLLLLDEPCLGLDDLNRQLVLALIAKIIEEGETTLVYVAHHEEDRIPAIKNLLTLG